MSDSPSKTLRRLNPAVAGIRHAVLDAFLGLERCLTKGWTALVIVMLGLIVGWWVYVPLHELAHAYACMAFGGEVSQLEISPEYGGALLARVFPFVVSGSEYAGRLSGFDTGGSDLVYLATDFGPFLFTLFPGVFLLRRSARAGRAFLFGFFVPWALAPYASLTGDAYEIGSIVTTWFPAWSHAPVLQEVRGDDLFLKFELLQKLADPPWLAVSLAAGLGLVWAVLTYALADGVARFLGQRPLAGDSITSSAEAGSGSAATR